MKQYLLILASIFVCYNTIDAQYLKVPIGKKYKVVTQTTNSIEVSIQDQHQEMRNESMVYNDLELKAITATGYTLELTPRRFKMNMNMMGMEQKLDTDSLDGVQGADLASMKSMLNQPITIVMDSNKLVSKTQLQQLPALANSTDDANRYFFLIEASKTIQGYQWADSSISKDLRTVNHYTIMSATATEVEINVTTDSRINTVTSMQGTEIKQNMKGFTTARRWYNRNNGLLLKEESTTDMAGTTETPETSSPMTLKLVLKIVVEQ